MNNNIYSFNINNCISAPTIYNYVLLNFILLPYSNMGFHGTCLFGYSFAKIETLNV